jgi:hypothetical protein
MGARAESRVTAPDRVGTPPVAGAPGAAVAGPAARAAWWRASALWAFLGSLLLAAVYGRVAVLNLTAGVVGGDLDGYENMWNNWWVKMALLDLHRNPFYTDYLYYPTGISLRYHTLNPFNGLITIPLNLTLGYVPTTNLLFLAALALTTFFCFLLIRDLVGNPWAAFAGAALFTFANGNMVSFFALGQAEKLSMEWLPLYLFFLFRAVHGRPVWEPGATAPARIDTRPWLYAGLAVLTLVIMSLTDWQYVMFAVFTTLLYFAFLLCTRRSWAEKRRVFLRLSAIGGIYAVLVTPPLLLPMIREALDSPWLSVGYQATARAVDLAELLGPTLANPGYLALALAGLGLWAAWRAGQRALAGFWALAVVLFDLMALGPVLTIGGTRTGIPLPYALMQALPVFNIGRDPGRYNTIAMLGVAVLAALGLRFVFGWAATRRPALGRLVLPATLTALFLAVSLSGFVAAAGAAKADPPRWPPFYEQIAHDPEPYAILQLPPFTEKGLGEDHYMMYQVLHQKPIFGGRWARDHKLTNPNNFMKTASLFRNFWLLDYTPDWRTLYYPPRDFLQRTDYATQGRAILNYYHTRYIVLWKDALYPRWDEDAFQQLIGQVLGPGTAPYYEDGMMRVYRVPDGPPAANPLTLDVGEGWFQAETRPDGTVYRLADSSNGQASDVVSMNLTAHPVPSTFQFTIYTHATPRTVQVLLNDTPLTTLHLRPDAGPQQVQLDISLPPGLNHIRFATPEPPVGTGNPHDARLLTFGMYGVALAAK